MTVAKKRDTKGGSRRQARLSAQRVRKYILTGAAVSAVLGLGVFAWMSGAVEKAGHWTRAQSLAVTAGAGFRVDEILVTGRNRLDAEILLENLGIAAGDPVFGVSLPAVQAAVAENPWVEHVTVSRRLPGSIVVTIREREPAALWQHHKKISLIDAGGNVLATAGLESYRHLPLVVGEDARTHVVEVLGLIKAEPDIARHLQAAVRMGGRRWDLRLDNGMLVRLPENNMELALRRLALYHMNNGLLDKNIAEIDLRVADKMVILPAAPENDAEDRT